MGFVSHTAAPPLPAGTRSSHATRAQQYRCATRSHKPYSGPYPSAGCRPEGSAVSAVTCGWFTIPPKKVIPQPRTKSLSSSFTASFRSSFTVLEPSASTS